MVDLTTTYLGLSLKNPLVASSSPLTEKVEIVKQMAEGRGGSGDSAFIVRRTNPA